MSFLKCCVGADPRPPPEAIRPVGPSNHSSRRAAAASTAANLDSNNGNKKIKMPTEVFFDPSKPDGQLSSITDPANSAREYAEAKKRKDGKDRAEKHTRDAKDATTDDKADLDAPDNNGLTRGQNFMKVEKWLRNARMYQQIDITPGQITNIEDLPVALPDSAADPPSEKDRLPPPMPTTQVPSRAR